MLKLALVLALLLATPALAEPPEAGSPQADLLAPYADWIRGLKNPTTNEGCCSLSDCRGVDYRTAGDGYEAYIGADVFDNAPDKWVKVPDNVVLHRANPTGLAIACWATWHSANNGFFCFTPTDGT